ncbi:hypothetical protein OEZ85_014288 [Tetradesmus obliquus]|uniref:Uncharacterized protein n=1 Tax=Tetradesmus obliquus TaxID=3088 RepID=A0ABY8U7L2_TETOB|nr:hypothetical protein OEZ85_014288 [Tetradesmus obliquus]
MIDTRKWEFHPPQLELHSPVHLQQMQLSQQQLRHQVLPQSQNRQQPVLLSQQQPSKRVQQPSRRVQQPSPKLPLHQRSSWQR